MKTKVELKKIQHARNMSKETHAFTADVYIDGKKTAQAENNGWGGETCVDAIGKVVDGQWNRDPEADERLRKAEEEIHKDESLPKYLRTVDYIVDALIQDDLHWKDIQKASRTGKIQYIDEGEVYEAKVRYKGKFTEEYYLFLKKRSWWKDHFILLNELDKESFTKTLRNNDEKLRAKEPCQ